MNVNENEKIKAAYALNLCTVSISQIIDYNDVHIMEQEYNNIINNLNLENMPKDETLLEVLKQIMDEITHHRIEEGDRKILERGYQHQLNNAVWSAVPNVGAIFATSNPIAMGVTLASQVGIGYMNYRRNKAEFDQRYESSKWQIQRNRMLHLNGLQKQLFETAWCLAKEYEFPDKYRLTKQQISEYNQALMETNPMKRYKRLEAMCSAFNAYPVFWYQIGSTANSVYLNDPDIEIQAKYRVHAVECFRKYEELNQFNLLRHDVLTSAWALEYLELCNMNESNELVKALELIEIAEKYAGQAYDVLELCAFAYLRIQDYGNAIRLFSRLVSEDYNVVINTQILSGLYIKRMYVDEPNLAEEAKTGYKELSKITDSKYILAIPSPDTDISQWKPEWTKDENFDEFIERRKEETREKEREAEIKKKARVFYQNPILLVCKSAFKEEAEYFLRLLTENRNKLDSSLPSPSRCDLKDYKRRREEIERSGTHVIMIGDSDEAKTLYKYVENESWDYDNLGMRYLLSGNKTVLLTSPLKNNQINDFIRLAEEVNDTHSVRIPSDVETVNYTFMSEVFDRSCGGAKATLAGILASPFLILGQTKECFFNGKQSVQNLAAKKKLEFLQFCILIYRYLDDKDAIVD